MESGHFTPIKPLTVDYSSIRDKLVYVSPTEQQYELLLRRTKEQVAEGRGETIIEVRTLSNTFNSLTIQFVYTRLIER